MMRHEFERRTAMWHSLLDSGGSGNVSPSLLRELGIYGGAQGIWINKERTSNLTDSGTGVTVGLLHTGKAYADDLSTDGVLYHYPATNRPSGRDSSEIEATKAAGRMGLPIFVITHSPDSSGNRDVYLGWVEDWDDALGMFLVSFSPDIQPAPVVTKLREETFNLTEAREAPKREVTSRLGQQRFRFKVFKRYGYACALCGISVAEVLDAAHLVPDRKKGSHDPKNGIVLCAVHHRALDAGLFAIEPNSLEICYRASGPDALALRVAHQTLSHLPENPHKEALVWLWSKWEGQ